MTTILIGDKKRPFKFGILAASVFCKETGKSINDLNDISEADIDAIINVLFAGLFQGAKERPDIHQGIIERNDIHLNQLEIIELKIEKGNLISYKTIFYNRAKMIIQLDYSSSVLL